MAFCINITDPNKKDSRHWNALHAVCFDSLGVDITEMVKLLVERLLPYFIINNIASESRACNVKYIIV